MDRRSCATTALPWRRRGIEQLETVAASRRTPEPAIASGPANDALAAFKKFDPADEADTVLRMQVGIFTLLAVLTTAAAPLAMSNRSYNAPARGVRRRIARPTRALLITNHRRPWSSAPLAVKRVFVGPRRVGPGPGGTVPSAISRVPTPAGFAAESCQTCAAGGRRVIRRQREFRRAIGCSRSTNASGDREAAEVSTADAVFESTGGTGNGRGAMPHAPGAGLLPSKATGSQAEPRISLGAFRHSPRES